WHEICDVRKLPAAAAGPQVGNWRNDRLDGTGMAAATLITDIAATEGSQPANGAITLLFCARQSASFAVF
ncbi:MAG TPA: hypothetical protein VHY82_01550, partial [Acetobacteraceae bacterium]|nr:hypothetical protein [Acetobacteraceae bacterium]